MPSGGSHLDILARMVIERPAKKRVHRPALLYKVFLAPLGRDATEQNGYIDILASLL